MPICSKCTVSFPATTRINGKRIFLHQRKYCLGCSPIGTRHFCGPKSWKNKQKDGRYNLVCSQCHRSWIAKKANKRCTTCRGNERRGKNRTKAIDYKGRKCQLCGYDKCKWSMDFHHIEPSKKSFNIGSKIQCSWEKLKAELDKCILICRNCHGEIHAGIVQVPQLAKGQH